jgi:pimeloyl-ACP methyl ester carboxylesterase
MARDAIAFLDALDLAKADFLDFSIGNFVTQEIALIRPSIVRRLVLASSAARGAAGMHSWRPTPSTRSAHRSPSPIPRHLPYPFTSKSAPWQAPARMLARTADRDKPTT